MRKQTLLSLVILVMVSIAVVACGSSNSAVGAEDITTDIPSPQIVQVVGEASPSDPVDRVNTQAEPNQQPEQADRVSPQVAANQQPEQADRVSPQVEAIQAESDVQVADTRVVIDANAIVAAYEEVLGGIYDSALSSVVQVKVQQDRGQQGSFGNPQTPTSSEGTGFVWSAEGYVVTNHHVIDGADRITLVFADGTVFDATVVGSDAASDLAVLRFDLPAESVQPLPLGDSDQLGVGQLAVAIGSPFGQEFSMTSGIVSALGRLLRAADSNYSNPEIIQTDAPINPGNSGGPLLDRDGRVIGINSQIISRSGASSGVGFEVRVEILIRALPRQEEAG